MIDDFSYMKNYNSVISLDLFFFLIDAHRSLFFFWLGRVLLLRVDCSYIAEEVLVAIPVLDSYVQAGIGDLVSGAWSH